jgi:hypothetical protein
MDGFGFLPQVIEDLLDHRRGFDAGNHLQGSAAIAVLRISFQQTLALQKAANPPGDGVRQFCQFLAGRRLGPTGPGCSTGVIDMYASRSSATPMPR